MFWFLIDILALRRLGLSRPFRYLLLLLFFGCFIAGVIYAAVVVQAVSQRNETHNVQHHSTR
jgi:hypothetical protein